MDSASRAPRRKLLKQAAALVGGAAGISLIGTGLESSPVKAGPLVMSLHGSDWRLTAPDRRRGVLPNQGERSASFGQLWDTAGGTKAGEFYASSFTFGAPFGPGPAAAAQMEMHHFNLPDGTIVGMGTIPGFHDVESVHAIIGGTGRYEGASGSYTARQSPIELGGDGTASFTFTIHTRGA